jgi:predicted glycosyltransferase
MRKRILLFCTESRGLGHLKRLSRIAKRLAEKHSVLVVASGSHIAEFITPPVEYIRIPPLDTSDMSRSIHWDRGAFMQGHLDSVLKLRTDLIEVTFANFKPHAMITDLFAQGRGCELLPHLRSSNGNCLNYLVLRGVIGNASYSTMRVFSPQALTVLSSHYQRLFVACDARVLSTAEYGLPSDVANKSRNVGYVYTPIHAGLRMATRRAKLHEGQTWIVCAAGSGLSSERLIEHCYKLALKRPDCKFTIVLGPHSRLELDQVVAVPAHINLLTYERHLDVVLGSCDIAIIHGGYNSLLESVCGGASVIVVPNENEDEQNEHAKRLSELADVRLADLDTLEPILSTTICRRSLKSRREQPDLDISGADEIFTLINQDLADLPISSPTIPCDISIPAV